MCKSTICKSTVCEIQWQQNGISIFTQLCLNTRIRFAWVTMRVCATVTWQILRHLRSDILMGSGKCIPSHQCSVLLKDVPAAFPLPDEPGADSVCDHHTPSLSACSHSPDQQYCTGKDNTLSNGRTCTNANTETHTHKCKHTHSPTQTKYTMTGKQCYLYTWVSTSFSADAPPLASSPVLLAKHLSLSAVPLQHCQQKPLGPWVNREHVEATSLLNGRLVCAERKGH